MTILSKFLNDLFVEYKKWVCRNPEKVTFLENSSPFLLSIITGKLTKSHVPYEWITFASRLLTFVNQNFVHSSEETVLNTSDKIKIFLTVLEYTEIALESTVQSFTGKSGKWKTIVLSQCFKCLTKLVLLLHYRERMICSTYSSFGINSSKIRGGINSTSQDLNNGFILKRSGRVVRMVHSAPPLYSRLWKPPTIHIENNTINKEPNMRQMAGEVLYLIKPIVNLGVVMKYGYGTWRPWVTSLLMDLTSLYLISSPFKKAKSMRAVSSAECTEMERRVVALLLYLLRSPFYEKHSKDRLKSLLSSIPFLNQILLRLLEHYLETYYFLWSK